VQTVTLLMQFSYRPITSSSSSLWDPNNLSTVFKRLESPFFVYDDIIFTLRKIIQINSSVQGRSGEAKSC